MPLPNKTKLRLLLDLAWIFSRLAHEQTFKTDVLLQSEDKENRFLMTRIGKNETVLDIGCGRGHIARQILTKTNRIVGVDYDRKAIEEANKQLYGTGVTLLHDDIFNYMSGNREKIFDFVILSHVLEHIENPQNFLKTISGFGRQFYIEVPDFEATHLNLYRKQMHLDLVYSDADHVSEFDRTELEDIITKSGLHILDREFRGGVMRYWCQSTQP